MMYARLSFTGGPRRICRQRAFSCQLKTRRSSSFLNAACIRIRSVKEQPSPLLYTGRTRDFLERGASRGRCAIGSSQQAYRRGAVRCLERGLGHLLWGLGAGERRAAETRRTAQRPPLLPVPIADQNGELFFSEGISVSHLFPQKGRRARPRPAPPHDGDEGPYLGAPRSPGPRRAVLGEPGRRAAETRRTAPEAGRTRRARPYCGPKRRTFF